ncbi:hypothetical protein ACP4OV_004364 [Aristida adscensionis]
MAGLKPSANVFALLEGDDPGDTDAVKAAELEANTPKNINKKQQPQPSVWKANVPTAAASSAGKNKKQQQKAAKANAAKNKKPLPPPPSSSSHQQASKANNAGTAANAAAKNHGQKQQPATTKAKIGGAAAKPADLTGELFGGTYPSARHLIYQNRKPPGPANGKDDGATGAKGGVAGGVEAGEKKGGQETKWQQVAHSKRAPPPAPAQVEPPAPAKPLPPPKLEDLALFPSLERPNKH